MFLHLGHLIGILCSAKIVSARFCEGGHICSLPRECCTQGCCPPYQSGPRQLPPASDHVLNLFFISHWYFWCVVVAIILAILCAYSLWKKRRTLCGWGFSEHHTQSEGDSAGSCYAPPQYSRCSSFHHPPPPYTEVTSKPDLYPLVFTCNSDNGKNGASYLMVQYFRNYIVRPAGSLSATSTVDSLSSSFICNANEANTIVPPPYSRATSPEIGFSSHFQQHYMIPRSASQLICAATGQQDLANGNVNSNLATQQVYQSSRGGGSLYTTSTLNGAAGGVPNSMALTLFNTTQLRIPETSRDNLPYSAIDVAESTADSGNGTNGTAAGNRRSRAAFAQSQSDQHFKYIANSNSSISDIFVNNSCTAELGLAETPNRNGNGNGNVDADAAGNNTQNAQTTHTSHMLIGGTPAIFSNGTIQTNPLHKAVTSPKQLMGVGKNPVYNSSSSIGGISITVPVAAGSADEYRDLDVLRRSLETCCQFLQQQQQQQQQQQHQQQHKPLAASFASSEDSPVRMHEFPKKYTEEALRSYVTSGTCSAVSSLANIGTPSSPPQATSPTGEVKEILDQIRQLQIGAAGHSETRPQMLHSISSPSPTKVKHYFADLQRFPTMPEDHCGVSPTTVSNSPTINMDVSTSTAAVTLTTGTSSSKMHNLQTSAKEVESFTATGSTTLTTTKMHTASAVTTLATKRPSTLQQSKKKFFAPLKPNKAMYIPMMATNTSIAAHSRSSLKSPVSSVVGANFFAARGRVRKGWISRSAPTTPGTGLPPNRLGDDSPLLNEHDEDMEEGEHNVEAE